MSLFDEPVSAHIGEDAVLWVGVVETFRRVGDAEVSLSQAIVVNAKGRVGLAPVQELTADWRWVPERSTIRGPEVSGPGWVDLDEFDNPYVPSTAPSEADRRGLTEVATEKIVEELTGGSTPDGRDYLVGSDGTKFDPVTNLPIDE